MSYNPDIPQPDDVPSQSQDAILKNFQQLNSQFSIDHVAFNAGSLNGFHKQIDFSAYQSPSTPADPLSVLYTASVNSHPALKFLNSQNASQYTAGSSGSAALLGGLIVKWGSGTGSGNVSITFGNPFPNNCYGVVATMRDPGGPSGANTAVCFTNQTTAGFTGTITFRTSTGAASGTFFYIAIGD